MNEKLAKSLRANLMAKQIAYLRGAQDTLDVGPTAMARILAVNYNTYKAWLYGVNPMPGLVRVALDCITSKISR